MRGDFVSFNTIGLLYLIAMFDKLPTDTPAQYLGGHAAYVLSGGERDNDMGQKEYAFVLNEACGLARVPVGASDGRANQKAVPVDEAGDDALGPDEYTSTVFNDEIAAWTDEIIQHAETPDSE